MIYKNVVFLLFMVYVVNLTRIMYDYAMIHSLGALRVKLFSSMTKDNKE